MKRLFLFLMLVAGLGFASSAQATLMYIDQDGDHAGSVWMSGRENNSETWTFNLDDDSLFTGDLNSEDQILTANLYLDLLDDEGDTGRYGEKEYTNLTFDANQQWNHQEVDTWTYGGLFGFDVTAYLSDHILTVTLNNVRGDFLVSGLTLYGFYDDLPAHPADPVVPEPATLTLAALGLSGLVGLRRCKTRKTQAS